MQTGKPGARLVMTTTGTYRVEEGETLEQAKQRYRETSWVVYRRTAEEARNELNALSWFQWLKRWELKREIRRFERYTPVSSSSEEDNCSSSA